MSATSTAHVLTPSRDGTVNKQLKERSTAWSSSTIRLALIAAILFLGIWLRVDGMHAVSVRSPDESTYAMEANVLRQQGAPAFRELIQRFQNDPKLAYLPSPTRAVYLWLLDISMHRTGDTSPAAGVPLSCFASIGSLFLVMLIGWRFFSPDVALFASLFYAISPVERIFAQRTWQESLVELIALSLLYLAARIFQGARHWYFFIVFALLGGLSFGLKEVSVASFVLCFAWVCWSFWQSRDRRSAIIFVACCLLGTGTVLFFLARMVGGLHVLLESTASNTRAQGINPYSLQFEDGPRLYLFEALLAISPIGLLFALPGSVLAWKNDHSVRGLVKATTVAACFTLFSVAFLLAAVLTPHRLNIRYLCMILGPLYLLSGLGFCWLTRFIYNQLAGAERRLFQSFAILAVLLGIAIDFATFHQELSMPSVDDLSVKMVLDAVDPIGPIRPMTTDVVPDEVEEAEKLQAKEPSPQHLLALAIQYDQVGRYEDSIAAAQKVLVIEPSSAQAYNTISAANAGEKHWDASIEAAKSALQINPNYQLAKNNLAWAQHEKQLALQGFPAN